ncbi:MAG: coproporphyrinogen III oxidase family protein [Lentisphaerae bacterium]|nr:coproporphyrinogen III oxidase family protein [Lentisphaerota bacterium]
MANGSTVNFDSPQIGWRNLYLHIPFCAGKCGYCAFYSESCSSLTLRKEYLQKIAGFLERVHFTREVDTVYIGGGTPDLLTYPELEFLFSAIEKYVPQSSDCEISCELNPECLTASKLALLNERVTRLSLGVQSFDPLVRKKLMRRCRDEHLRNALKLLEKRQVKHFNIDLIYGVSDVEFAVFANDMQQAWDCGIDHLSCYALTAEENSRLGLAAPVADDASAADWWLRIGDFLSSRGLERYEISNYALPNCGCRHNLNVWCGETLLGVGASAAGFDGCDRYTFPASVDGFIAGEAPEIDRVTPQLRMLEIFAVNLRTTAGWQKSVWDKLYPATWDTLLDFCCRQSRINPQWWQIRSDKIALSEDGLLFWDDAAMEIIDWDGLL